MICLAKNKPYIPFMNNRKEVLQKTYQSFRRCFDFVCLKMKIFSPRKNISNKSKQILINSYLSLFSSATALMVSIIETSPLALVGERFSLRPIWLMNPKSSAAISFGVRPE